jgi:hypothetical protein
MNPGTHYTFQSSSVFLVNNETLDYGTIMSTVQIRIMNLNKWTDFHETGYKSLATFPSTYNKSMAIVRPYESESTLEPLNVGSYILLR